MPVATDQSFLVIVPAASALLGAIVGGLTTFFIQLQRLGHEKNLEERKAAFARLSAAENRRVEFRLKRWEIESEALLEIKKRVKDIAEKLRVNDPSELSEEILSGLSEINGYSSRITRHNILIANLFAFDRDVRQFLSEAGPSEVKTQPRFRYHGIYEFEKEILSEADRLILEQPDLTRQERLVRAVAFVTADLSKRDVFAPEDEAKRTKVVNYLISLKDEEIIDLSFENEELSQAIESFQASAGSLFQACDLMAPDGETKTDPASAKREMIACANRIRRQLTFG